MKSQMFWDEKHPRTPILYSGRPLPNRKRWTLDVRNFIWTQDIGVRTIAETLGMGIGQIDGTDMDRLAHAVQNWAVRKLIYTYDAEIGCSEYWLFPGETIEMRHGDCEDGAILIASILLSRAAEPWRVRVVAGEVRSRRGLLTKGHAWCEYCRSTDNEWIVLDWCYEEDSRIDVAAKQLRKEKEAYFGGDKIWFSFNNLFSWAHQPYMTIEGRIK